MHVCVGTDRVLRHEPEEVCPAGTTEFHLAEAEPELEVEPSRDESVTSSQAELAELRRQLTAVTQQMVSLQRSQSSRSEVLSQRVSALEAGGDKSAARPGTGSRVVAPFVVVDRAGKAIFSVRAEPRGFVLATATGEDVAFASALANGGFFKARAGGGAREVVMGGTGDYGGFEVRDGAGQKRAVLALMGDSKPILGLRNDNNVSVLALTTGASGGGLLQLGDASGNSMVEAGTTAEGVGLVRAYPLGSPGAGLVGMPGTFILGRR
ncbi:MAG: hypothetical protein ABIQ49_15620 [Gemmatimonadales bacterium]